MTEPARNTVVGLTAIVGMAGLAWLIFIFGDAPKWVVPSYTIHVKLDDASGLDTGSPIRLDGIQIGEIETIHHRSDGGTRVICRIETRYDIPANVDVFSESSPLGGSATLKFVTNPPNSAALAKSGKPAELSGRAASFTSQLGVLVDSFTSLSEKIEQLAAEYTQVGQAVRSMVEERSIEDVEAGRTEPNLSTVISRADRRVAELATTIKHINDLVGNEKLHKDLQEAVRNARQFTEKANTVADKAAGVVDETQKAVTDVRKLTGETEKKLERLTQRYVKAADDLSASLKEFKALAEDFRAGEGSYKKLIEDPALYDSLKDAADRIKDVMDEAELLLQKWKAEGLPIKL